MSNRAVRPVRLPGVYKFENRRQKLLPLDRFIRRLLGSVVIAASVVGVALAIGVLGYHLVAHLSWVDSILNASMILTGMGPVAPMVTSAAKLFASAYALFSGVVFLSATSVVLAPVFHRILHTFHMADEEPDREK